MQEWIRQRKNRIWTKKMDFKPVTEKQKELLNQMLFHALVEIRGFCWSGQSEQAAALTDAFHNLPVVMYSETFSFPWFRQELESYEKKYRTPDHQRKFGYTYMLDKVMREEDLFSETNN